MFLKKFGFILIIIAVFFSCNSDKIEPFCEEKPSILDCSGITPSFVNDIQPIFINSCATVNCHSSSVSAGGYTSETYQEIKNNDSLFLKTIKGDQGVIAMPYFSPKLDDSLIKKIECWINQGSLNN